MKTVLLASKSPRRQEMLRLSGLPFRAEAVDTPEQVPDGLSPAAAALHIARGKADASAQLLRDSEILLAADTVVAVGDQLLAKPADVAEGMAMLRLLSGKTHEVITGVVLRSRHARGKQSPDAGGEHEEAFFARTEVEFASLSKAFMRYYVEQFRPFDKAGGYAIQEWIGLTHILAIRGCFYNVVGLPMPMLFPKLLALGVQPR
ncbi:MAG: septum formation protein Maf [Bacteroidetes bacterium]|nr:septum formation protein Maf [Bacteroidota bacterium]